MSFLIEYLIAFLVILLIPLYFYLTTLYRVEKFCKKFPNPPLERFYGNAKDFPSTSAFLKTLHRYTKKYGGIVHVQMGPIGHVVVCTDYKLVEFLLSSNKVMKRSLNFRYLEPWLGQGLLTADGGSKWKMHRRLITPAFHFKILEQFIETFEECGSVLIEKLSKESGNKSVDIYPYVSRCTLDVICETAMGTKIDVQNNETSLYFNSVKEMCRIFMTRTTSITKRYDFLFKFSKDYEIQEKCLKILHSFSNSVISKKREELKERQSEDNDVDDLGIKKKKAFLDLILDASVDGKRLSPEELREEVDTFMFGGHDTTATASSFILFSLANNKEVQDKVYEEQVAIFGDNLKEARATYTNLQEMKYLDNTIKEGLRLYPAAPVFGRHIQEDVDYNGMTIPKGAGFIIFAQGIHMNPEYYPNPEKFDPSRFEKTEGRPPFAYIPFGAGSRNCIGQKYAVVEMKTLISKVVRNFELYPASPEHHLELAAETVLVSHNGVKIGLKLR